MTNGTRERLETAAQEQWGERWTIEAHYFADDTERLHAYSNRGRTDDGDRIRERLMPVEDGELNFERVVVAGSEEITNRDTDDDGFAGLPEELLQRNPLIRLFDDGPRIRILAVLIDAGQPLNPTSIVERAQIGERTWYNHKDELLATGIVEEAGQAGNSPLYALVDIEDDRRAEWLQQLQDWTGAYLCDGERPSD